MFLVFDSPGFQNMHYDMEDLLEQANEIQESLGRSYAVPDEIDEADLEAGTSTSTLHFSFPIQFCRTGCFGTRGGGGRRIVLGRSQ